MSLQNRLKHIIEWRNLDQFYRKDFNFFMMELALQADLKRITPIYVLNKARSDRNNQEAHSNYKRDENQNIDQKKTKKENISERSRDLPPLSNLRRGKNHLISDLRSQEMKKKLN